MSPGVADDPSAVDGRSSGHPIGERSRHRHCQPAAHAEADGADVAAACGRVRVGVGEECRRIAEDVRGCDGAHEIATGVHVFVARAELTKRAAPVVEVRQHDVVARRCKS